MCSECLKERTMVEGEPAASHDILVCLKCGFQVRSNTMMSVFFSTTHVNSSVMQPSCCFNILHFDNLNSFQGCNHSGIQHAVKHHQALHPEYHCITISLSTWKAWWVPQQRSFTVNYKLHRQRRSDDNDDRVPSHCLNIFPPLWYFLVPFKTFAAICLYIHRITQKLPCWFLPKLYQTIKCRKSNNFQYFLSVRHLLSF